MNDREKLRKEVARYEEFSSSDKAVDAYQKAAFDAAFEATQNFAKALNGGPSRAVVMGILAALMREHRPRSPIQFRED